MSCVISTVLPLCCEDGSVHVCVPADMERGEVLSRIHAELQEVRLRRERMNLRNFGFDTHTFIIDDSKELVPCPNHGERVHVFVKVQR